MRRERTQRRGDARRRRLLDAARALLERRDLRELTFIAVCAEAGVPPGSARYFYPDLDALLRALIGEVGAEHDAALLRPLRRRDLSSSRALLECLIDRAARFHGTHPVAAKLTISGETPPELKRIDREADRERARAFLALLEEHFVVPRVPHRERVAFMVAEIIDLAFMLSMNEAGRLTPAWIAHAKAAAGAVMAHYFGAHLRHRPAAPRIARR